MNQSEKKELVKILPINLQSTKEFTENQKLVLAYLLSKNGMDKVEKDGYFFLSNSTIKNELGISERSIINIMSKLITYHFIERKSGYTNHSTEYILNLENINNFKEKGTEAEPKTPKKQGKGKGKGLTYINEGKGQYEPILENITKCIETLLVKVNEIEYRFNKIEEKLNIIEEQGKEYQNRVRVRPDIDIEEEKEIYKEKEINSIKNNSKENDIINNNINLKENNTNIKNNNILKEEKESVQVEDKLKINKNKIEIDLTKFQNNFNKSIIILKEIKTIEELNSKFNHFTEWLNKKKVQYNINLEEQFNVLTNTFNIVKNKLIKESYNTPNKLFTSPVSNDCLVDDTITPKEEQSSRESLKIKEREHMHKVHNNRLDKAINDMEEILTIGTRYNTTQEYNINEANAIIDNIKDMSEYYKELPDIKEKFSRLFEIYNKIVIPITV